MARYYIVAGEASGDLHASNLIRSLKGLDSSLEIRAWGGNLMEKQGATIVKHYRELAFMGFLEVILNLRTILKNLDLCKKDILEFKPDALILVDYPGFNLKIAKWAKSQNLKVIYYISPQIWAWKENRVELIRKYVDKMICILPFEKDFYAKHNVKVDYVGHPLLDHINTLSEHQISDLNFTKPVIALLPGSRKQEVLHVLPIMLEAIKDISDYTFVIAGTQTLGIEFYRSIIQNQPVEITLNRTYDILKNAKAALVTSGTATLETALWNVPQVVCYKGSYLSYIIGKQLVKIKYISLVNLILDKPLVKELIQNDCNSENIKAELVALLNDENRISEVNAGYEELITLLGKKGASAKAANIIHTYLA